MNLLRTVSLLLLLTALPAAAGDLVSHPDDQNRTLQQISQPVRVINLWAGWCTPCRKEMPALSAWYRKQDKKRIALIGIALDSKEAVSRFLHTTPVSYPVWRYTGNNSRVWMQSLGNLPGALPYTVLEQKGCKQPLSLFGEVDAAKLDQAVKKLQQQCR